MLLLGAPVLGGQRRNPVRWFGVKDTRASVELRYESLSEDRKAKGLADDTLEEDWTFQKIFGFGLRGYVYHPRFLDFDADVGMSLEDGETLLETSTERHEESRSLRSPLYEFSGRFLSQHPVSLSFRLAKSQSTFRPAFGDVAVVDTEEEGLGLDIKTGPLPTQIFYSHSTVLEDERSLGEDRDRELTSWGFTSDHEEGASSTRLSYAHRDDIEDITNVRDIETQFRYERRADEIRFDNRLGLGESGKSHVRTLVTYYDETGTSPSERFHASDVLHLAHTDRFSTDYGVTYGRDTTGGSETEILTERVSLAHQLYESLFTNAEIRASQEEFDVETRDVYGASVDVNYRKRIPWGRLTVDLGVSHEIADEEGATGVRTVLDERHSLSGTTTTLLNQIDVMDGTIVATNAARTTTYIPDVDYRVLRRGDRTELRRIASGAIPSGSTVLVNYSYMIPAPLEYQTVGKRARVQLDLFDHVTLYAGRDSTTQDLLSGIDDSDRLEDIRDTVYGVRVDWGPATLTAEHQDYESTTSPFSSDMMSLSVVQPFARFHRVTANASYRRVTSDAEEVESVEGAATTTGEPEGTVEETNESTVLALSGAYGFSRAGLPSVLLTVGTEHEEDRGFTGDYMFYGVDISYALRRTQITLTYRANRNDDDFALERSHYFFLSIRREF